MGGGDSRLWLQSMNYVRSTGCIADSIIYLNMYKANDKYEPGYLRPLLAYEKSELCLFHNSIPWSKHKFQISSDSILRDTSSGPILSMLGFRDKRAAEVLIRVRFGYFTSKLNDADFYDYMHSHPFYWGIASRAKLMSCDKIIDKVQSGKPVNRLVSLPDPFESVWSYPIYKEVMRVFEGNRVCGRTPICIGMNKYSDDWVSMGEELARYDYILEGDWSAFDSTVSEEAIELAFGYIKDMFKPKSYEDEEYLDKIFDTIKYNFIHSQYVLPNGTIVQKHWGVPSGSQWTSLIDSIVNYNVLQQLCRSFSRLGILDWRIFVYGDDHLIGFSVTDSLKEKWQSVDNRSRFLRQWVSRAARCGLKADWHDFKLTNKLTLGYSYPIYPTNVDLSRGTGHLKPLYHVISDKPIPRAEREHHRWSYVFDQRPSFLKMFWDREFHPVRATSEVMSSLANPESPIKTVGEWIQRLLVCYVENYWNFHLRNHIFQYLYDAVDLVKFCNANGTLNRSQLREYKWGVRLTDSSFKPGDRLWFRYTGKYDDMFKSEQEVAHLKLFQYAESLARKVWGGQYEFNSIMRDKLFNKKRQLSALKYADKSYKIRRALRRSLSFVGVNVGVSSIKTLCQQLRMDDITHNDNDNLMLTLLNYADNDLLQVYCDKTGTGALRIYNYMEKAIAEWDKFTNVIQSTEQHYIDWFANRLGNVHFVTREVDESDNKDSDGGGKIVTWDVGLGEIEFHVISKAIPSKEGGVKQNSQRARPKKRRIDVLKASPPRTKAVPNM